MGTNIDINVVAVSPLFSDILTGAFNFSTTTGCNVNEHGISRGRISVLADFIAPIGKPFATTIHHPANKEDYAYGNRNKL